jgi:hypothetical protein
VFGATRFRHVLWRPTGWKAGQGARFPGEQARRPPGSARAISGVTKAGHFDPSQFKDEFEIELRELVKRKAAGKPVEYAEPAERPANIVNLMEALRRSVERPQRATSARSSTARTKTRRTSVSKRKRKEAA